MAEGDFQVVFRGELTGERPEEEVRQQLSALFKMPEEKVAGLFTGKPIVVKRNLDEATARKFEAAFNKAGAKCEIRSAGESASAAEPAEPAQAAPQEPPPAASAEAAGSGPATPAADEGGGRRASMAAAGDPNNTMLEMDVPSDLSDLDVDESDAPLSPGEDTPPPDIDTSELSVAADDSGNLSEHEPPAPADIDTSGLSLEDSDS